MENPLLPESALGVGLDTAVQRDFFQFFHLRVTAREETAAGHEFSFSPVAEQFRSRVSVQASVDAQGRFRRLMLSVDRSVIDDRATEPMARDIIKSFLADATPLAERAKLHAWINDIRHRHEGEGAPLGKGELSADDLFALTKKRLEEGRPVTVNLGPPGGARPVLAAVPSPAYEVLVGERESCEMRLAGARVALDNRVQGETSRFQATVEALPDA